MLGNTLSEIFNYGSYFSLANFAVAVIAGGAYAFADRESWIVKTFVTGFLTAWILAPVVNHTMLRPLGLDLI
jgi:hypothetical protein